MTDREVKAIKAAISVTQETVVIKRYLEGEPLVAEIQLFQHEGFREGDIVKITVEKIIS